MAGSSDRAGAKGRLGGKRAIVTGAASGIGRASAILFAEEGASVLAVDRDANGLEETVAGVRAAGGEGIAVVADVSREDEVDAFVQRCIGELGGLEVLFANAGMSGGFMPLLEQSVKYWDDILRVNLIGTFLCLQRAARHMLEHDGGSIVCTASVAALRARAGGTAYSASKAGVVSLVQTAANEFTGKNVRVNAICPGLIETGMTRPIFDWARATGVQERLGQFTAAQRAGTPLDVARVALFLASEDSAYMTGQAIAVDGGLTSSHPFGNSQRPRTRAEG
jgi:NAD(P)-dependent dehydrogenase (short-subunit alcohol dehydrogenase family)